MIITCPHCSTKLQVGPGHGLIVCPNCQKEAATIAVEPEASVQNDLSAARPFGTSWSKYARHGLFVCLAVASGLCLMFLLIRTEDSEQPLSSNQQSTSETLDSQLPVAQQESAVTPAASAVVESPERENAMLRAELAQLQSTWKEMVAEK